MGHRKYVHPRYGSLGFAQRKRSRTHRGRVSAWPSDDTAGDPHLCAFVGFKAGMTQVLRQLNLRDHPWKGKDVVEPVTVMETPKMVCVGLIGYEPTPDGLKSIGVVWAPVLADAFRRRMVTCWSRSVRRPFHKALAEAGKPEALHNRELLVNQIKKRATVIRAICHTQPKYLPPRLRRYKRAWVMEVQVNGGTLEARTDFILKLFEKEITVFDVFKPHELVDAIGVTTGHGRQGVVRRFGVKRLPRKTHRGRRKVACIGSWNPARIQWTVARGGQMGYHHRTELNKRIYWIGTRAGEIQDGKRVWNARTAYDLTDKDITPLGGFPHYGTVMNEFLILRGSTPGPRKRPITLRKPLNPVRAQWATEELEIKWIDTSSHLGHGRFQTQAEKIRYFGLTKKQRLTQEAAQAEAAG